MEVCIDEDAIKSIGAKTLTLSSNNNLPYGSELKRAIKWLLFIYSKIISTFI